jgi:hypothetical protein
MTAFNVWGNKGNEAYAMPMVQLTPVVPTTQGYVVYWNTTEQGLDYAPLAFDPATGDATTAANFGVAAGKAYHVNSIQVVGSRKTGWAAATGTATRATFDAATVTTAQLAERVKALLDDLISHGLIGA